MIHKHLYKKNGFTMVEIVVAALVFALTIAGLLSAISSLNRPSVESFEEVQATYIASAEADKLARWIDAETWYDGTGRLNIGGPYALNSLDTNGVTYTGNYTVTSDTSGGRWVNITISWN